MLLGCLAGGCCSGSPKGGLCWAVSPPGGSTHGPPRAQCGVRKGGVATVGVGAASSNAAPGPPCLLWQMHRCRNPAPPAPQGLRAFSPWLSTPRRLRRGVWRVLGDVGAGGSSLECGQATQSSNLLPWHSVRVGAGLPLALRRRTSYQSGGCAGRGSWRRPCPESERHRDQAQTKAPRLGPPTAKGTTACGREKPAGMRIVVSRGGHPATSQGHTLSSALRAVCTECR